MVDRNYRLMIVLGIYAVAAFGVLALASHLGAPVWFTGGMDCTTAQGIQSCVGYPPTGAFVVIAGVIAVGEVARSAIGSARDRFAAVREV